MAFRIWKAAKKVKSSRIGPTEAVANPNLVEEGHLAPFAAIARCHNWTSLGPDQERSDIKEAGLRKLRDKYFIPNNIILIVLGPNEPVLLSPFECIAFNEDAFALELGSHLSFYYKCTELL